MVDSKEMWPPWSPLWFSIQWVSYSDALPPAIWMAPLLLVVVQPDSVDLTIMSTLSGLFCTSRHPPLSLAPSIRSTLRSVRLPCWRRTSRLVSSPSRCRLSRVTMAALSLMLNTPGSLSTENRVGVPPVPTVVTSAATVTDSR